MKSLLEFIIRNITQHPQDATIKEQSEKGELEFVLHVNSEDLKIVIGKKGRTIKAIRDLLRVKAGKQGQRANLILEED